ILPSAAMGSSPHTAGRREARPLGEWPTSHLNAAQSTKMTPVSLSSLVARTPLPERSEREREQPCLGGGSSPWGLFGHHGVEGDEQSAHAGDESHHSGFAAGDE